MIEGLFAEIELTYYSPNASSIEMQPTENILDVTKFQKEKRSNNYFCSDYKIYIIFKKVRNKDA